MKDDKKVSIDNKMAIKGNTSRDRNNYDDEEEKENDENDDETKDVNNDYNNLIIARKHTKLFRRYKSQFVLVD